MRGERWLGVGAYVGAGICLAMLATFLLLAPHGGEELSLALGPDDWREEVPFVVEMALGGVVGALLAVHRPRNPIGWLMILLSVGFLSFDVVVVVVAAAAPAAGPAVRLVAWTGNWVWVLGHVAAVLLLLLLPNGQPLSRRWAVLARVGVSLFLVTGVLAALIPGPLEATPQLSNPLGFAPVASLEPLFFATLAAAMLVEVLAVIGLVARFVRASGVERQQLKWIAYGAVVLLTFQVGEVVGVVPRLLAPIGGVALTVALLVAVTRHRLYDIDRLISRTLTYAVVTGVLLAVYAGSVLALRPVLDPLTGGSDLAVAGSTLAVAALFGPLRRRVQAAVDHRFNRRQYDARRAVESFGHRLRDEVLLEAVAAELRRAVSETVQPTTVATWIPARRETTE
jgi:hypothetical protein